MKNFKVLAIDRYCEEIQKVFNTREEAEAYAKLCEEKECFDVHIAEGNF